MKFILFINFFLLFIQVCKLVVQYICNIIEIFVGNFFIVFSSLVCKQVSFKDILSVICFGIKVIFLGFVSYYNQLSSCIICNFI